MRGLIGNFAIAAVMAGLFAALLGTQVGMAVSAAREASRAPVIDAQRPIGPSLGARPDLHHPAA